MERNFAAVMSELRHARGLSQRKVAADLTAAKLRSMPHLL